MVNLSRLRDIVHRPSRSAPLRELTYEPAIGESLAPPAPGVEILTHLANLLGGRPCETDAGACLVIERRHDAGERHGDVLIGECAMASDDDALWLLAGAPSTKHPEPGTMREVRLKPDATCVAKPLAFLDIETTGLSGGAGTCAFLVGIGTFAADGFRTRQYLLTGYGAERALLAAVAGELARSGGLVTFNGKTFDLPVLETRWLFHRQVAPFGHLPHFDMLHPARRLWRHRAGPAVPVSACNLTTLEELLLAVSRRGDVPGAEIPSRFFRFLRSGDPRPLLPVLEHNRLDLVSLAAVAMRICRLVREGVAAARDAHEALALGGLYDRIGDADRAEACYAAAAQQAAVARAHGALAARGPMIDVRAEALRRLAVRHRRARRHDDAVACWQQLLALEGPSLPLEREAVTALAVHHEHRGRDAGAARAFALRALGIERDPRRREAVQHRLARLERKIRVRNEGGRKAALWTDV